MRNQVLITLDSLRWDVFNRAYLPFMKSFPYAKAYTHGTYTLPAHESFFIGKLPTTFKGKFDTCARSHRVPEGTQQWRLNNPESPGPAVVQLSGRNIVDGFNILGYKTLGTGAMEWFNHLKPAHIKAVDDFDEYYFNRTDAKGQVSWLNEYLNEESSQPYFIFANFGETHHPFSYDGRGGIDYGDKERCLNAQAEAAEFLDTEVKRLISGMRNTDIIICSDHGECLGEDGLWGHSFYHQKVIEVPILKIEV